MKLATKVINQDIKAAQEYFKKKNFDALGIMGNRVMSNLVIGENNDLIFLGYLIREIASDYKLITVKYDHRLDDCMDIGNNLIQYILKSFTTDDEFDTIKIWENFYIYEKEIIKFLAPDIELLAYEENIEFTKQSTNMLMQHLEENKHLLFQEGNQLLIGVGNEISRVINTHGFRDIDLMTYLLIKAFIEYYLYIYRINIINEEYDEELKQFIYSYLYRIIKLPEDTDKLCKHVNDFLNEIGYHTRILFMNYQEPRRRAIENKENEFKMPIKSKEKIGKMIKRAIEKEVK